MRQTHLVLEDQANSLAHNSGTELGKTTSMSRGSGLGSGRRGTGGSPSSGTTRGSSWGLSKPSPPIGDIVLTTDSRGTAPDSKVRGTVGSPPSWSSSGGTPGATTASCTLGRSPASRSSSFISVTANCGHHHHHRETAVSITALSSGYSSTTSGAKEAPETKPDLENEDKKTKEGRKKQEEARNIREIEVDEEIITKKTEDIRDHPEDQGDLLDNLYAVKEDKRHEEHYLGVVELEVQQEEEGRTISSSSSLTGCSETSSGLSSSSSTPELGGDCYEDIQGAGGGTRSLQELYIQVRGEYSSNILHAQGNCKRAAVNSGFSVPPVGVKTTSAVGTTNFPTNHSKSLKLICGAQQGLATPSATSQGNSHHQQTTLSKEN